LVARLFAARRGTTAARSATRYVIARESACFGSRSACVARPTSNSGSRRAAPGAVYWGRSAGG